MKPKSKVLGKGRELVLTAAQHDRLHEYAKGRGGYQALCGRVHFSRKAKDGKLVAFIYNDDMERRCSGG